VNFLTTRPIFPEAFFIAKPDVRYGALATFFGVVRNHHEGRAVRGLYYEAYASMANRQIRRIKEDLEKRWKLGELRVLHRTGELAPGEIAVGVLCSSGHRAEAFAACEEAVERIKHEVPIWKHEFYEDGGSAWVLSCSHAQKVPACA
jgi:molybdopterin synthase catalytic subunit